jgi:hypothetical protein
LGKNECKCCVDIFVNMRIHLLYAKGEFKKLGIHNTNLFLSSKIRVSLGKARFKNFIKMR